MARYNVTPGVLSQVVQAHKRYWDDQKRDMYKYKRAYECKFWDDMNANDGITVQTQFRS